MDLTELVDYFLPRVTPQRIRRIARRSWGVRNTKLSVRLALRLLELILSLLMPKPEKEYKWIGAERLESGFPVTYHHTRLLIAPMPGIRGVRTYVLFNTMTHLLGKR